MVSKSGSGMTSLSSSKHRDTVAQRYSAQRSGHVIENVHIKEVQTQLAMKLNIYSSTFRTVIELVKRDPSIVNDEDEASNTPLHLAAIEGHVKCCKALLERGAEVDAR